MSNENPIIVPTKTLTKICSWLEKKYYWNVRQDSSSGKEQLRETIEKYLPIKFSDEAARETAAAAVKRE